MCEKNVITNNYLKVLNKTMMNVARLVFVEGVVCQRAFSTKLIFVR